MNLNIENLQYKNKYLKYKDKYLKYKIQQNITNGGASTGSSLKSQSVEINLITLKEKLEKAKNDKCKPLFQNLKQLNTLHSIDIYNATKIELNKNFEMKKSNTIQELKTQYDNNINTLNNIYNIDKYNIDLKLIKILKSQKYENQQILNTTYKIDEYKLKKKELTDNFETQKNDFIKNLEIIHSNDIIILNTKYNINIYNIKYQQINNGISAINKNYDKYYKCIILNKNNNILKKCNIHTSDLSIITIILDKMTLL